MLTLAKRLDDQREAEKGEEHDIELVEAAEDAAETLEPAEQPLDFVATTVPGLAVPPRFDTRTERWDHRGEPEIEYELASLVALVRVLTET